MAAWPTAQDLIDWVRESSVNASSNSMLDLAFEAADEMIRDRLDDELMEQKAGRAGIVIDEDDDDYDADLVAAFCPSYVKQAILIRAAGIYTRRDSANGTIAFGEFAARVSNLDPTVEELLRPVTVPGIA